MSGVEANKNHINDVLSKREHEIARLVAEGMSNKGIGRRLSLAEGTVKCHLHNIYQKMAIRNRRTLMVRVLSYRNDSGR
jgi:two-component system, NarL family, nitrate/nitrite response regulator NarL